MVLADSHAHLLDDFFEKDFEEVMERAKNIGVEYINNCLELTDNEEIEEGLELTKKYDSIFLSAGVHPFNAKDWNNGLEELLSTFPKDKLIAIGEIGIDPTYDVHLEIQKETFRKQIQIAKRKGLPIIIHCRYSFEEVYQILKEESFPLQGVLHTFSGTWKEAERFLDIGFYISFSGVLTYSKKAKEVALKTPFDRILIETDSPYLAPIPYKGQRNEPSYILRTVEELSRLKGSPIEKTAEITTENFISLFLKEQ
jgi:TatD DNase family protein